MSSPVFLLASERSGTNLLRRRLTEHQDTIFGPAPLHFLKHLHYAQPYYGDLRDDDNFLAFVKDGLGLAYHHFSPWDVVFDPTDVIEAYPRIVEGERSSVGLMHTLYTLYAESRGYSTYFCKDNNLFEFAHDIRLLIPGARFVYLHRDPRDVILSQRKRPSQNHGLSYLARLWRDEQIMCIRHATMPHNNEKIFQISYEDLVRNEGRVLQRLATFLGVELSNTTKSVYASETTEIQEWANLGAPTIKHNYGKFMDVLSDSEVRKIEAICWHQIRWLNYETVSAKRPAYSEQRQRVDIALSSLGRLTRSRIGLNKMTAGQVDRGRYAGLLRRKWR